eukprot:TRINITY_DN651_c0_g1_i1.p1 TRINITY_DN651_c0_g1~~TRINITY_DN651_c0_g1_i1.p1  ORF type:complete len:386 (+),score=142.16 TRINITY_DN651_c0_g1_i1:165-1160(+)
MANVSSAMPMCAEVLEGTLGTSTVSLVTTGIGHDRAAACMVDVLSHYDAKGETLVDIMYMGTSGFTPKMGGFYDLSADPTCRSQPSTAASDLIGIGDVCISPYTLLLNCGFCKWNETSVGECSRPDCTRHSDSSVFGKCDFATQDLTLSNSVLRTAGNVTFAERTTALENFVESYWSSMWSGLHLPTDARPSRYPRVLGHTQCAEAAAYDLWTGTPDDYRCRTYTADLISSATGKPTTPSDVVCVSAMEGPGWVSVLMQRAEKQGKHIPFVNIRGNSDYAIEPLSAVSPGVLVTNTTYLTPEQQQQFVKEGYLYAIASASRIILAHYGVSA